MKARNNNNREDQTYISQVKTENVLKELLNNTELPQSKIQTFIGLYQLHRARSESKVAIDYLKRAITYYQNNHNGIDTKSVHSIIKQLIIDLINDHNQMINANKKEMISYLKIATQLAPNDAECIKLLCDLDPQGSQLPNTSMDITDTPINSKIASCQITNNDQNILTTTPENHSFSLKDAAVKSLAALVPLAAGAYGIYYYNDIPTQPLSACDAFFKAGMSLEAGGHVVSCIGESISSCVSCIGDYIYG